MKTLSFIVIGTSNLSQVVLTQQGDKHKKWFKHILHFQDNYIIKKKVKTMITISISVSEICFRVKSKRQIYSHSGLTHFCHFL